MISITNDAAAAEAENLARDLFEIALARFAQLPEGVELTRLLAGIGLELREARADSLTIRWHQPHETVEVDCDNGESAGAAHAQAVKQLTKVRTADLAHGLPSSAVAQIRESVRDELIAERERLSRPLRLGWLRGAKERRRLQLDSLVQDALTTLEGVPLSAPLFEEVLTSVLSLVGAAADELPDMDARRERAAAEHRQFHARRETILMHVWEAIATDGDGADLELAARHDRFGRAKANARASEAEQRAERVAAVEAKKQEELSRKRVQIAREQEERRKWDKMTRPTWAPDEPEPDTGPELGA